MDKSETEPTWEQLFEGMKPADVKARLDHAREWEKRAKENKKALDELSAEKESSQTEVEKTLARLKSLEEEVNTSKRESLRYRIANDHKLSREDADLFLTGTDEDSITAQAKRLAAINESRKQQGEHVPNEGTNPQTADSEEMTAVRGLFGG